MKQKIIFRPITDQDKEWLISPTPATKHLPQWYRNMPKTHRGRPLAMANNSPNMTVRACVPVLDAMTAGYMVTLQADILIDHSGSSPHLVSWRTDTPIAVDHSPLDWEGFSIAKNFWPVAFKWLGFFYIETPPGYSTAIVHPQNRWDLPFTTMAGVVDTDKYPTIINFPFFLHNDAAGIIKRGTPIAQIIPFKRSRYKHQIDVSPNFDSRVNLLKAHIKGAYRNLFWTRKAYQ